MNQTKITGPVRDYYTQKIQLHGTTSLGVDWKTVESQELRFDQLLGICRGKGPFSLVDWGCGYGSLAGYMKKKRMDFRYTGFDLSLEMVRKGRERYSKIPSVRFKVGAPSGIQADYAVASGIFNVRLKTPKEDWKGYMLRILDGMNGITRKGFAFNCLTQYSDKEKMRGDLYYADPLFFFDHCKRRFSKNVALLHDYGLYEFTILVRKDL